LTVLNETQKPAASALSPRETQVLELTAHGLTNDAVAKSLEVSIHAVKFHLSSIYKKLGVKNRTEAVVMFLHDQPLTSPARDVL
jgi:DNA-binding NarL/FixJ family response regulator